MVTAASGLLVPEWLLDPPKGRSMVSVPGFGLDPWGNTIIGQYGPVPEDQMFIDFGEGIIRLEPQHFPLSDLIAVPRTGERLIVTGVSKAGVTVERCL